MFDTRQQHFKVYLFNAQPQDPVSSLPASLSGELADLPPWQGGSGRESNHSPPSNAEVRNEWSYNSAPHTPSWAAHE